MPSRSDKEVKESLKKNEEKFTLRFNTCLILMSNIEDVVMSANKSWKNIYCLHKPSDFPIQIDGKDEEEEIVLKKPPPTFEERLKAIETGSGMINFKIFKYELRTTKEKKWIEDMVMKKMGKWKYSLDQFPQQIPEALMMKV